MTPREPGSMLMMWIPIGAVTASNKSLAKNQNTVLPKANAQSVRFDIIINGAPDGAPLQAVKKVHTAVNYRLA